jgi:hypothetical protein
MGEKVETYMDSDPFGLSKEAEGWLKAEEQYYKSRVDTTYIPGRKESSVEVILPGAYQEFARRLNTETVSPVLLISTNVSIDWVPPELAAKGARFLVFPQVEGSPLFLTYMPGPVHGAADDFFCATVGRWQVNDVLQQTLSGGLSSGSYGTFQPDKRILPNKRNKDNKGRDIDSQNGGLPYTRLHWEVEHGNRDPVEIRQRGKRYMNCRYTRLFLACKIFEASETMLRAAIVLWGKPDPESQVISVLAAVSFGTEDLSDEEKQLFSEQRSDRLVGVAEWTRPANTELDTSEATTPNDRMLTIPYQVILYKVTTKRSGTRNYMLEELNDADGVTDLVVDLKQLALRICDPDVSESENED